ncbi:hypothetical protein CH300_00135 [Rhodococcus sp. 15-1154-1]|nr:hypothetical protein [Rhodococcus sp. 15-1154-1]OZF09824.1 hypothetical protein CH300_00135 [Rhodococcus sp. 15-1154-1]
MTSVEKPKPVAPVYEGGYVNGDGENTQFMQFGAEDNPELQWPQSIDTFARMEREDAQVTSVLRAVLLPIRRTPWKIRRNGARPEVVEWVARDLNLPIEGEPADDPNTSIGRSRGRFSWNAHLRDAMQMFKYGHAFFEQVAEYDEEAGLFHLRKLAPRKQNTISKINVALDGGLESIEQRPPASMSIFKSEPIPVNRLVAYVFDQEPGIWTGNSLLRPAHKHWKMKDHLLRVHSTMIDRNGLGVPVFTGADGASKEDLAVGRKMATDYRSGRYSGAAIPFGAELVLKAPEGNLPDALPGVKYHDEQIGRAALTHFLNLGQQTGSWALGSEFANFFIMTLQTVAEDMAAIANQHVVEDLVDWNWGENEQAPLLVFEEIGSQHAAVAEALKVLVDAGILFPDRRLEEAVREKYGLPAKESPAPSPTQNSARRARVKAKVAEPKQQGALFDV